MKFDKYTLTARVYPSIIILVPFLLFTLNCDIENLKSTFDDLLKVRIIGNISISIVLLYFLIQVNRFIGKFLFEKVYFKDELEMPTTKFLLFSNNKFSDDYKQKIRDKVLQDFQMVLPDEYEEQGDIEDTQRRIVEAVGLIRNKVKNGRLLLQHNMEYGFARNLVGGSIIALLMSFVDIIYFFKIQNELVGWISVFSASLFLLLLLLSKSIINQLGEQYAKRLFQEYL